MTVITEQASDVVTVGAAAGLHGLLDAGGAPPRNGEELPPLWHWLAFVPRVPQRSIGADGHPRPSKVLDGTVSGRRMIAGGRVTFDEPLVVGVELARTTTVTSVTDKTGRSGHLRFVTLQHDIGQAGDRAVLEEQHIVYTTEPAANHPAAADAVANRPEPALQWDWEHELVADPTMLFRFSALTYNAHRIHYDREYATRVEGHSGLVVQGPLQAIALAELLRTHLPELRVVSFAFRAVRPAFEGAPLRVVGRLVSPSDATLQAIDAGGSVTMTAEAKLRAPTS